MVLVEVLSKTSEAYDRGAKANHYRRIEVQRRNAQGHWELRFFGAGEQVELASVDARFDVDAVYVNPLQL